MDYRAYSIGPDGHITGFEPIVSDDDEQAIAAAKRLVGAYDIELWQGTRIVTRLSKNSKD